MALDFFKLERFTIQSFNKSERSEIDAGPTFKAQFNPTQVRWNYAIAYGRERAINSSAQEQKYKFSESPALEVTLTIDGTDVDSMGFYAFTSPSVKDRVAQFKAVTFDYRGDRHEPPYLRVSWGSQTTFDCRLRSFSVNYTLFDRDGTPLRAEIKACFVDDIKAEKLASIEQKSSPDLTHARMVRHGDTLPLLTKDVYGSSAYYLDVARYNGIDDFRRLTPGQEIMFPPLVEFAEQAEASAEEGNS